MLSKLVKSTHSVLTKALPTLSTPFFSTTNYAQSLNKDNLAGPGIGSYEQVEQVLPHSYNSILSPKETQIALKSCKDYIENSFTSKLNLIRVECPLTVTKESGLNDMLDRDGSRTPVGFYIKNDHEKNPVNAEVVQAATKWKRPALKQYELTNPGEGLFTDMRAIRKDYFLDHDHSSYVSQWDWEMTMKHEDRNLEYLFDVVKKLYSIFKECEEKIFCEFDGLNKAVKKEHRLPNDITFIHSEELFNRYKHDKNIGRKERETLILKEKKVVFLCGIGYPLKGNLNDMPHELRACDYDDWVTIDKWPLKDEFYGKEYHGLNGDILAWNDVTNRRHELSSMGIRVTKDTLYEQLQMENQLDRLSLPYHHKIMNDEVPLSIGGGIGQSRTFMYLLRKAHIGEVEVSLWPKYFIDMCKKYNIHVLQ